MIGACRRAEEAPKLRIAAATNFKPALDQLAVAFADETGEQIEITYGSTGQLYAQITNGAPFDLFLAADEQRPAALVTRGLAKSATTYALGRLCLWQADAAQTGGASLSQSRFNHIAIANPKIAPYGRAALETIAALELSQALKSKIVRAENVGQAYAFVKTGNAQAGFVACAYIRHAGTPAAEVWHIPSSYHAAIRQNMAILARAEDKPMAEEFSAFMHSAAARALIKSAGYDLP